MEEKRKKGKFESDQGTKLGVGSYKGKYEAEKPKRRVTADKATKKVTADRATKRVVTDKKVAPDKVSKKVATDKAPKKTATDKLPKRAKAASGEVVKKSEIAVTSKPKSQLDQEKIQAAQEVLSKYGPMLKELSEAAANILVGTAMRPIHKRIEEIQAIYEVKKESLMRVQKAVKDMNSGIEEKTQNQIKALERLEKETEDFIRSEDLEDTVGARTAKTLVRTMVGSFSARVSKMPYTFMARYHALAGDDKKRDGYIKKAREISNKKMTTLRNKNEAYNNITRSRIKKFNKVEKETDNYTLRTRKVSALNAKKSEFLEKNEKGKVRRTISLNLAKTGEKRIYRGDKLADLIERFGNSVGRKAALRGLDDIADFAAKHTADTANQVLRRVNEKNDRMYSKLNRRTEAYDNAVETVKATAEAIKIQQARSRTTSEDWGKAKATQGVTTRVGAEGVKIANRAVTASTKFVSQSDMAISGMYARGASVVGLDKHSKKVAAKAQARSEARMDKAEEINKKVRYTSDRVFDFKDKRKENIKSAREFIEALGEGIAIEASEAWEDIKGAFGDFVSEIEAKKLKQQVKRKFKSADRKVAVLELLSKGAQKVLNLVGPSLQTAMDARAAAQAELEMNPEKKKIVRAKKNLTGRDYE